MCRMFAFRAARPRSAEEFCLTAPHAIIKQSGCDLSGRCHRDGWGLGWYQGDKPVIRKSPNSALDDPDFARFSREANSTTAIAHVRDASVGSLSEANSHPFACGPWMFAHNGTLTPFAKLGDTLVRETDDNLNSLRLGTTDSEHIFYWLLSRMRAAGLSPKEPCTNLAKLATLVGKATLDLKQRSERENPEEPTKLNFILTDGQHLIATRFRHSLSILEQSGFVVLASEPTTDEPWREILDGSVITIDPGLHVSVQPL